MSVRAGDRGQGRTLTRTAFLKVLRLRRGTVAPPGACIALAVHGGPLAPRRTPETSPPKTSPPKTPAPTGRPILRAKPLAKPDSVTDEARRRMIAESAYLRAERRGFLPGGEEEDWLEAEAEVDALLRLTHGGSPQ